MKVIVCLDDNNGMTFNSRRQSRDKNLLLDIKNDLSGKKLLADKYSENILSNSGIDFEISSDFPDSAGEEDICFIENKRLSDYLEKITSLTVYRWNRVYPADFYFDLELDCFKLISTVDFAGTSHEKITKEVYGK